MGIMVQSLLWVMRDLYHQPYGTPKPRIREGGEARPHEPKKCSAARRSATQASEEGAGAVFCTLVHAENLKNPKP